MVDLSHMFNGAPWRVALLSPPANRSIWRSFYTSINSSYWRVGCWSTWQHIFHSPAWPVLNSAGNWRMFKSTFSSCCLCNCPILLVKLSPSNCQHQVFFFLKPKSWSSLWNDESRRGVSSQFHHLREILFHLWEHLNLHVHLCPRLGPLQHLSYTMSTVTLAVIVRQHPHRLRLKSHAGNNSAHAMAHITCIESACLEPEPRWYWHQGARN